MRTSINVRVFVISLCSVFFSKQGDAAPFYFDFGASSSYAQTSVASGATAPTILQHTIGVTLAYRVTPSFMIGLTSDMRYLNQYSEPTDGVENRQGTRLNAFSPTVGYVSKSLIVKADYQFAGDYRLTSATMAGNERLEYKSPTGGRLTVLLPLVGGMHIGAMVEALTFKESNFAPSLESEESLTSRQFGLVLAYALGAT